MANSVGIPARDVCLSLGVPSVHSPRFLEGVPCPSNVRFFAARALSEPLLHHSPQFAVSLRFNLWLLFLTLLQTASRSLRTAGMACLIVPIRGLVPSRTMRVSVVGMYAYVV